MRYLLVVVLSIFSWTIGVAQISVFPHNEDFETFTTCFESCTAPCVLSSNWTNVSADGTDWITDANGTLTAGTGPTANGGADHNPGTAGGKYLYLESTSCTNVTGIVESPYLDFTGGTYPYVTFWYHMYGGTMGTLHFDVTTDSGATWTNNVIPSITSNTNVWQQATVGLGAFGGQIVKVRFRGNIGAGSSSDMAIDDVTFHLVEQMNVGVTNIQSNDSLFCSYDSNEICIEIVNSDSVQLDSAILNVRINGALFNSPFPFTTNLAPGASTTICLGQAPLVAGDVVTAVISMPNGVPDSVSANDSIAETIVLQALPTINLTPDTLICPDDTITIGGSPTGPTGATYTWATSGGFLSSTTISNPLASTNSTEMYYLTVTDTIGCVSNDSFQISNHALPVVDAGADVALCPLVSYTFGGSPTSATGVSFVWYGPNGNLLASVSNPNLVINNIGEYVVIVEDANTCVNSDTMEITAPANVLPNAGIDTTVCVGDSIEIGELASAAYNYYDWSPGALLSDSTISNPMVLVSAPIQYVLEVQDTFGCVLYDTLNLSIHSLPSVDAGTNTTICLSDSVTLGGAPTSTSVVTYNWSPGILMLDSNVANPIAEVPADTTFYLTVEDANGCFNYDSVSVSTDSLPEINAGQDLSICYGDVALIGGFPAAAAGSVFNWSPGNLLSDSTIGNPQYTVTSNQIFILEVTDTNGCHGYDTVDVSINTSSVLPQTPDTTVCLGDTFLFSSTPSAAFNTFSWSSTAYMTNVNTNPVETFVTGTTEYTLAATDTFGCGYVDTITVFAYAPVLIDAGPDVDVCLNDSVTLGGSPTGNAGSLYNWSGAGLLDSSNVANPTAVSLFDTVFILQVVDTNSCVAYDTVSFNSLELPILDAGIDQSACIGETAVIGGTPSGDVSSTFSWSPGQLLNDSTIANPSYLVADTASFVLMVTDTNSCVAYDTAVVNAFPLSVLNLQNDTTICQNIVLPLGNAQPANFVTFNWSPGTLTTDSTVAQTSANMNTTTQYLLEATDLYGCEYYDSVLVNIQPAPFADAGFDDEICFGETYVLGGSPTGPVGASFSWTSNFAGFVNGDTNANPSVTFTTAGIFEFIVEVSDSIGCPTLDTVNITVRNPVVADAGADQVVCNGDSTTLGGAPTGLATSTFTWSSSAFLSGVSIQNPTTTVTDTTQYSLIVQDTFGCFGYDTTFVFTHPLPNLNAGADTAICIGDNLTLGGSPTAINIASISWSPGVTLDDSLIANPLANPSTNTTYTATLTDIFGCVFTDVVSVAVNALPIVDAGPDSITNCAFASFSVGGAPTGPAGSIYSWTPGALFNDDSIANPTATVTANSTLFLQVQDVNGCYNYDSIDVSIYPIPNVDAGPASVSVCFGDTAQLGGTPTSTSGVTYLWSSAALLSDATSPNPTAVYPSPMYFYVTVTDTVNGCTNVDSIYADFLPSPDINAGADTTICIGDSVQLGGAPTSSTAISYVWTPNSPTISDTSIANPFASNTVPATYYLMVTDNQGCISKDTVTISINQLPTINISLASTPCPGDTIQTVATGGQSYQWTNNSYFSSLTVADPFVLYSDTMTVYVEVTDTNQCVNNDSLTVSPYADPYVDAGPDLSICVGQSVQLQATSATNPVWSPDSSLSNAFVLNPVASPDVNTDYILTSTTGGGACVVKDTMTVSLIALPVISLVDTLEYCDFSIGEIAATTNESLNYSWSVNSASITLVSPIDSVLTFTASDSAYVYLEVTNTVNGCVAYDSVFVVWYPKPVGSALPTPTISCIDDSVQLQAMGGDIYQWSPGYQLSNSSISNPILIVYGDTTLNVIVTSNEGCSDTVDVPVAAADLVVANAGPDVEICQLDTIQLSASGGLTYEWNVDASLSAIDISNPRAFPVLSKTYTVTASDQYGCFGIDQVTVVVNPLPNTSAGIPKRVCLDDQVQIGGNPTGPANSTYVWSPAMSIVDNTVSNPIVSPSVNTTYYVTVTSSKGCQDSSSVFVTVDSLPTLDLITEPLSVCRGDSAKIEVTSGIKKYNWSPGTRMLDSTSSSVIVYPTQNTTYTVVATDGRGCNSSLNVDVEIFQLPVLNQPNPKEVCLGDSVDVEINSATGVSYLWQPASSVGDSTAASTYAKPSETSTYRVYVTDENGCTNSASQVITVNPLPFADAGDDISNCDMNAVYLGGDKTALPGTTISWEPAEFVDNPYALNPLALTAERTMFYVTVQDDKGCESVDSILVNADCYAIIYAPTAFTPGSNNLNDEFLITHYRVIEPKLTIYNRWGEVVFETEDLDRGWDGVSQKTGTEAIAGVFYWTLVYKSDDNKKLTKDGTVTLIR